MNKKYFFSIILFCSSFVYADIQETKLGPLHEAFVTKEQGEEVLQAIKKQPPSPLQETEKVGDKSEVWVEGYWAWVEELEDFVWVSGMLRKAPPGHKWVKGSWKQFGQQTVWVPGYWTAQEKEVKISFPPPAVVNERVPAAASPDYFWAQGNWEFSLEDQNYHWKKGRWEKISSWIFVPGRYLSTGSAFIFIPAYWDYPLEERGDPYINILVPQEERECIFSPQTKVSEEQIIQKLFSTYPQYLILFQNFLSNNKNYFLTRGIEPVWWEWQSFWTLPFRDHMWLFWWWTHPGYPTPPWMTATLQEQIKPASKELVKWMRYVPPPLQVTKEGVLTFAQLIKAIHFVAKEKIAILPSDVKIRKKIFHEAHANNLPKGSGKLKKTDEKQSLSAEPLKPDYTLPEDQYPSSPKRMTLPPYPEAQEIAQISKIDPDKEDPDVRYPMEVDKKYPGTFPPDARFYNKQRMESYNFYEGKNADLRQRAKKRDPRHERGYFVVPYDPNDPFDDNHLQNEENFLNQKKADNEVLPPKSFRYSDKNYYSQPYKRPRPYRRFEGNPGPEHTRPLEMQHRSFIQSKPQDNL